MSVVYINKPKGITSFDVCYKLRKVLNTKRIGHSGTLDPNATGVMIICSDKDTKALEFLKSDIKEYIGTCIIGIKTDSLDITGNVLDKKNEIMPNKDELVKIFKKYTCKYIQTAPLYSALKVNGKKMYQYALKGQDIELKKREVEIYNLELLDIHDNEFKFKCRVSSGTYIRSLLNDILNDLNIIGTLKDLERIKAGDVTIDMCSSLDNIKEYDLYDVLSKKFKNIEYDNPKEIMDGKSIKLDGILDDLVLITSNHKCIAIYKRDKDKYTCVRGLF